MKNGGERYQPQSHFNGAITAAALYMALRGIGHPPVVACHLLLDLIRSKGIRTEPKLSIPVEILPVGDGESIVIIAKETYPPQAVLIYFPADADSIDPPTIRGKSGRKDQWDWDVARAHWRNLRLRRRAEGKPEPEPKELGDYFQQIGGKIPDIRSLRRKVREWRKSEGEN